MTIRVGINGFGRIGRNIFRVLYERSDIEVAAICDVAAPEHLVYLLKYDTLTGAFGEPVELVNNQLAAKGRLIPFVEGREPGDVRWRDYDVDVVIEASGRYRDSASLTKHLEAGARRVVLTVPPKGELPILVPGINDAVLESKPKILSAGSLALNALAPVLSLLDRAFSLNDAQYTLVHAYTNRQTLGDVYKPADLSVDDVPHEDLRRSRSAPENIIPASTHSPVQLEKVLPHLASRVGGMAVSGAVSEGSVIDLLTFHPKTISSEQVNAVVKSGAASLFQGRLAFCSEPIVSADVAGNESSAIFDSLMTKVICDETNDQQRRSMVKTLTWYDNGWSFAHRVTDLVNILAKTL